MREACHSPGRVRFSPIELLVILVTLLFPVNYSLLLKLRPADFLMMMLIVASLPAMRIKPNATFLLSVLFFLVYVLSTAYGIMVHGIASQTNFLFVYKYLMLFALFWVLCSVPMHPVRLARLRAIMNAVFYFLVAYVFLYVFLWVRGAIGGSMRVTFPFTNDYDPEFGTISDSPLYSVV
ncbi:MAG TPA: hypothetical protein VJ553_03345, partial [Candidatus Paceibacterota bacterium]|nr:hypothetical protein [Candidatus Paceibacterota bacterium]